MLVPGEIFPPQADLTGVDLTGAAKKNWGSVREHDRCLFKRTVIERLKLTREF